MTSHGFSTEATSRLTRRTSRFTRVAPLEQAIDAIERGVTSRSRRVVAPGWVEWVLPVRALAQRVIERALPTADVDVALEIARGENAPLTTLQP